jgi:hypothetical protein
MDSQDYTSLKFDMMGITHERLNSWAERVVIPGETDNRIFSIDKCKISEAKCNAVAKLDNFIIGHCRNIDKQTRLENTIFKLWIRAEVEPIAEVSTEYSWDNRYIRRIESKIIVFKNNASKELLIVDYKGNFLHICVDDNIDLNTTHVVIRNGLSIISFILIKFSDDGLILESRTENLMEIQDTLEIIVTKLKFVKRIIAQGNLIETGFKSF